MYEAVPRAVHGDGGVVRESLGTALVRSPPAGSKGFDWYRRCFARRAAA